MAASAGISLKDYQDGIRERVQECYDLAKRIRALGKDVTDEVEIPLASDMADRIEELLKIKGVAEDIRAAAKEMTREEMSIFISRKVCKIYEKEGKVTALDKSVRTGLAILTEGILVAPLEGIAEITVDSNPDGTSYASIFYSGPIRGAGGTAQAMSVLIADIVRRDLGIGSYVPSEEEIERYVEEVQSYNRLKHLQYLPSPEEIRTVISNSPICIDGEGSEEEEVSGHRDMNRVRTNRIRGGMCLVLCEGLIQKSKKILKYTGKLGLNEWEFLSKIGKESGDKEMSKKQSSEKFLKDIIAGRPVFSHPGTPGGFRLRYGRSRLSGLAAASIHPATMRILGNFIASGSQIKVELPGKAAAITPCDTIDGPTVLTKGGDLVKIRTVEEAIAVDNNIQAITDVGEILIAYGDFLENNRQLEPSPFVREWWLKYTDSIPDLQKYQNEKPDQFTAIDISRKYKVPLYPEFDYLWHDITAEDLRYLINVVGKGSFTDNSLVLPFSEQLVKILISLNLEFRRKDSAIILHEYYPLVVSCGYDLSGGSLVQVRELPGNGTVVEMVSHLSGLDIRPRSPTRVGARLGRPEKAGERQMKPKVHVLFPLENNGQNRRSIIAATNNASNGYEAEIFSRRCLTCNNETPLPVCEQCGSHTIPVGTKKMKINIQKIMESAMLQMNTDPSAIKDIKGVKKLMSAKKVCEPLEKGILRYLNAITINKDGTCRYDMSDIPITHFRRSEISVSSSKLKSLGYEDCDLNEIFPQDIIIPDNAAAYLLRVAKYVDDLLVNYYKTEPFYMCRTKEDLIGQLVIGLAPHTSGGIAGRIVGFTSASGCYAHPFFHAAKRRNCDGDEDSIMLLMDGLINFSREYLPSTRGGLMDAPLVLTVRLNPDEVDKEAMNLDTLASYPLEFYEATERHDVPSKIEKIMRPMKVMMEETGTYRNCSFNFDTASFNDGTLVSAYKTIGSMEDKIEKQLDLARVIRAVDADDVAARVLTAHFLPDIFGNFRGFFTQEFRCTKCNAKYRRVPLSGKCLKCKNNTIILTIHKGNIVKYLDETIKISKNFRLPDYLNMRIINMVDTIESTFEKEENAVRGLEKFEEEVEEE
ncbi:MAG: DNA polymerase II large subunit [Thermoplasmatales archaeon B_DKE]|nr:MAG: DNA polymerase II large subunit [Thermoplasmatales archaeon B_DKE]QRF75630.1 DNA polymerase II large subunit [Thermoplasmatales archaeon]